MAPWTLARLERAVEGFSAQLQCAICLCAYAQPVSLPCNHCFCEECIHRALELKALCPICKTPAKKRRLRYDTTVQELLRATEMLCAAPAAEAGEDKPAGKQEEKQEEEKLEEKQEKPKQDKPKQVKVAAAKAAIPAAAAAAAATPERRSSPRRAKRNSQKSPATPTLMDVWVSGGSTQLCNGMKIKTEKMATPAATPVRRSSPRRALAQEMESQVAMTPMSPALFEIPTTTTPSVAAAAGTKSYSADDSKTVNGSSTSPGLRSDSDEITMDIAATCIDETQLEIVDLTQQTESSRRQQPASEADKNIEEPMQEQTPTRRRRSAYDANEGDGSPDETQLEQVELTQQTPTRRRKSATDAMQDKTGLESVEAQTKTTPRTRRRNATDETHLNGNGQTPTPRKRRRSASNSVAINDNSQMVTAEPKQQSLSNGKVALTNGSAETSSLPVQSHEQPLPEVEIFQVGDLVEVIERQWVGINKRGGAGRIVKVHGDGFYAVKFLIGTGTDHRVPGSFIRRPAEDIVSDSTPSRAVRKRQRRRPSDVMASPDLLTVKTRSSPHSIEKTKSKTVSKSKTKGKSSGMVFLCSGFKEDRMRQIDKWADMLGAEVVQYWSNHVTHLIVKCVSGGMEDEGHSMEDSDSATSPQGHKDGKRKLFSDSKLGRWVKIRSLKYLKALVGGRWIVSDEWLEACADHGGYVSEVNYEADGHWKGRRIHDAVKRSRLTREKLLQLTAPDVDRSDVGTMLFADFCFHVIGEFLPPMPPITELNTLICMGGGKLIAFMDEIPDEMHKRENRTRKLIIVSDKINPIALRQQTRQLKAKPQVKSVSEAIIVNYLWVINSISEAKLRELPQ